MSVSVKPTYFSSVPELFNDDEAVYNEIVKLASLVQLVDPSLPSNFRLFRRALTDSPSVGIDAKVLLTKDIRPDLENGLQDSSPVDLLNVVSEKLSPALVNRLQKAMSNPDFGLQNAFSAAAKAGKIALTKNKLNADEDMSLYSSSAQKAPELAFSEDPFLMQMAILLAEDGKIDLKKEGPAQELLGKMLSIRQALRQDVSTLSVPKIKEVIETINSLPKERGYPYFEQKMGHGFIAYSVLSGGQGWAPVLLSNGGHNINPHTSYLGASPIVAAIAKDDAVSVKALLENGVSSNTLLQTLPLIFDKKEQLEIQKKLTAQSSLLGFASVVGSNQSVSLLIKNGADITLQNNNGETPLMSAVKYEHEKTARVLLDAGFDFEFKNKNGLGVSDLAKSPSMVKLLNSKKEFSNKLPKFK